MSDTDRGKLGEFLKEVINWQWDKFCRAEKDPNYKGYEAAVFSLVRTSAEANLSAIKLAINRVDGKIETPVKVIYPKVFFLYPQAERVALPSSEHSELKQLAHPDSLPNDPPPDVPEEEPVSAATMTLRQTLRKLADHERIVTQLILKRKEEVEQQLKDKEKVEDGDDAETKVPLVKSVIAANLLNLAEKNNFEAISEIFDQIDGKLVETIRFLGDDLYLTQYALEAPHGAKKNKDGVYMLEAKEVADLWKQKLNKD